MNAAKHKPIPRETTREWFCAHILQDWRRFTGPQVRKAYRAETDAERVELLRELRTKFAAYVAGCDSELSDPSVPMRETP